MGSVLGVYPHPLHPSRTRSPLDFPLHASLLAGCIMHAPNTVQFLLEIGKFYTKFGDLIPRKMIEFVATRCQILRLKGTKFNFGWGTAPNPAEGAYSTHQAP